MPLPHLRNSKAGLNKYDAVFNSVFEVSFTIPELIREQFGSDEAVITEHIQTINGLSALNQHPGVVQQKFMNTERSFIKPSPDTTHAEIEVKLSLNLRNSVDNYIYKLFRAWAALGWDVNTGARSLKKDYCADWLRIDVANQAGDIYYQVVFKDVMMNGPMTGNLDELDYGAGDPRDLNVKFVSDWWQETIA